MKWNPFSAKGGSASGGKKDDASQEELLSLPGMPDMKDMNMFQRFAMKRLMKMSPAEREKMMKKAMTPKNIEKNKGEILASLESMRKAGQISDDQYRLTKAKLGLK
jgi:hypothetical protein